jgi:hypothetical protein
MATNSTTGTASGSTLLTGTSGLTGTGRTQTSGRNGTTELPGFDALRDALPVDTDRLLGILRNAAYVVIGVGVLTVQQVQARARDLVASLQDVPSIERLGIDRSQVEQIVSAWETQLATLDERFEALETQLDTAFAKFEERLPEPAANVLGQAHDIAKTARKQVRELLRVA